MNKTPDIIIAGIGETPVGEHWDLSLRTLAGQAIDAALSDCHGMKPDLLVVANIHAASFSRQAHLATLLADWSGLNGLEAVTVEAGGASGGAALRQGCFAITSGMANVVLVVGVEKYTDLIGPEREAAIASELDADYESIHGLTPAAQAALLTRRYLYEYGLSDDALAHFSLVAHEHGAGNGNAFFRKAITLDAYHQAERTTDPLNIYDLAPYGDGAAAVVLTRQSRLSERQERVNVHVSASTAASASLNLADRRDFLRFTSAEASVNEALMKAGCKREDISFFEYADLAPVYAALSLEAAGFAERGTGWRLAQDGSINLNGKFPCATMGGYKARGNPGGAAGLYQAVEAVLQLRGEAGVNQVKEAKIGLIQCLGGPASLSVTHILERTS